MLTELIVERLRLGGTDVIHRRVSAVAPDALLRGATDDPLLMAMIDDIDSAHGVIVATPIYKASYSGLLKCFLDILPQFALAGKAILPIGTGGSVAHVLALDYALRPVLQSMGARHIVQSHFVAEASMRLADGNFTVEEAGSGQLWEAVRHFVHALSNTAQSRLLGHPRPPQV